MKSALYTPEQHEREHLCFVVKTDGERCDVVVTNGLNELNSAPLRKRVVIAIDEGARLVRIDLTQCDAVQRIGYSMLLSMAQAARKVGGSVTIVGATDDVRRLFDYHGISGQFAFADREVAP